MNTMRSVGTVLFLVLLIGGGILFAKNRKEAEAQAEVDAAKYFQSLMVEDATINLNTTGVGAPVHPWMLKSTPTQLEMEEKAVVKNTTDGTSFTWKLHYDPTGGKDLKEINVVATYDSQGQLSTLKGFHGTVTPNTGTWVPE